LPHTRSGSRRFLPASVLALRQYTPQLFVSDLIAGVTVGLVALPLAVRAAGPVRKGLGGKELIPVLRDTGLTMLVWSIAVAASLAISVR
jgi:1,4-dihydroxy-2-naphthoate octaprenyltransferase